MSRQKTIHYATLIPRTDKGKEKLSYHGERWIVRGSQENLKFASATGTFLKLLSRDGNKMLLIKKDNDPDFIVRL